MTRRGGAREKEEEKGRRTEKSGTLSWGPHVMRFSLFTSMDTKSPPTVFISLSLIPLFSAVNLLSLLSRLFSQIPRHLHYFLISSFSFATSLPAAFLKKVPLSPFGVTLSLCYCGSEWIPQLSSRCRMVICQREEGRCAPFESVLFIAAGRL